MEVNRRDGEDCRVVMLLWPDEDRPGRSVVGHPRLSAEIPRFHAIDRGHRSNCDKRRPS